MLGDKRFLKTLRIRNLLSFGPQAPEVELKSLNVLIGPNGAGKSNLIEVISLLQSAPRDLFAPVRNTGGAAEWIWKGSAESKSAEIETVAGSDFPGPFRHRLSFAGTARPHVTEEIVEDAADSSEGYYSFRNGKAKISESGNWVEVPPDEHRSALGRPDHFAIRELSDAYSRIRIYRDWGLGRGAAPRRPQPTDLLGDFLDEDASNLSLVLNDLEHRNGIRSALVDQIRNADSTITNFSTRVLGGTIQLFVHYEGLATPVPATRVSDGTLRFLCLLAILIHPDPPPLVCIEEPELGLHPDLLPILAKLLIEASHRMQLIVTTHSEVLVDSLTETPEAVVVCEKHAGETRLERLSREKLSAWLEDGYGVGRLWRIGEIGGNRW